MLWLNDRSFAALGRSRRPSAAAVLGVVPAGCVAVAAVDSGAARADVAAGADVAAAGADVAAVGVDFASDPQAAATRPIAASVMIERRSAQAWMFS